MTYAASYFRDNMWKILDKAKSNKEYITFWRRRKEEFYVVPAELWEEKKLWNNFDNEVVWSDNNDFEVVKDKEIVKIFNEVNGWNSSSIIFG